MNILVEISSRWSYQAGFREEIHGFGAGGLPDSWCERRKRSRGQGEMEPDDSLWRLLERKSLNTKERKLLSTYCARQNALKSFVHLYLWLVCNHLL